MVKKERSSNFELMRIVSMLFIVICHIIVHGNFLEDCARPSLVIVFEIIKYLVIVHVNSFVLLMGFFQIKSKFKLSKLFKLLLQVMFYSIICLLFSIYIGWIKDYNITTFITKILPSVTSDYWFINIYIIIYLFSDYINKFINRLSRNEHKNLIIICFIVLSILPYFSGLKFYDNNGYNVVNFLFLYIIGAYIRLYSIRETYHFKKLSLSGYKMLMIFVFLLMCYLNFSLNLFGKTISGTSNIMNLISSRISNSMYAYSPPFVIIQSICYFELFHYMNLKNNKFINYVSSCTLGVYLLHENPLIKLDLYRLLRINTGTFVSYKKILILFFGAFLIFILGVIIECIRKLLIYIINKMKIYRVIKNKLINLLDSFNYKVNW